MKRLFEVVLIAILMFFAIGMVGVSAEENDPDGENANTNVVVDSKEVEVLVDTSNDSQTTSDAANTPEEPNTPVTRDANVTTEDPAPNAEPAEHSVSVKVLDTRTNKVYKTIINKSTQGGTSSQTLKNMASGIGTDFKVVSGDKTYTFKGIYDAAEGGNKIDANYNPSSKFPELKKLYTSETDSISTYRLYVQAADVLDADKELTVYVQWDVTEPEPEEPTPDEPTPGEPETPVQVEHTITVNVFDTRTNKVVKSITNKNTQGGESSQPLSNMAIGISDDFKIVTDDATYTFRGFYDAAEGGNKIDANYNPGTTYPDLMKLYSVSDATLPKNYRLWVRAAEFLDADKSVTVYIQWDVETNTTPDDPTPGEPDEPTPDEPVKQTVITIVFKEESDSGEAINSGNGVNEVLTSTMTPGSGWSRPSRELQKTTFDSGNRYIVDGWYDEDGNPADESLYVNGNPLRIRVGYNVTADSPAEVTITYILRWKEYVAPVYNMYVYDEISNGSHHWGNTTGHWGSHTYTFITPEKVDHYSFVNYRKGEETYNPGDKFSHECSIETAGTNVVEKIYAWWKADITLNLYDGTSLLGSESKFDSISVSDVLGSEPTKTGYRFLGWVDENGNAVDKTTFEANPESTNPEPKTVNLYAKWEKETVIISVAKEWDDKDNYNNSRPETVMVLLLVDGEEVNSTLLSEDNGWYYEFKVDKFDANGEEIIYDIDEVEVENYWTEIEGDMYDGFVITNSYLGEGGNDDPVPEPEPEPTPTPSTNPKTGDNVYTYMLMLLVSLFGLVKFTYSYVKNN